jgi:hypothetical protein
MDVFLVDLIGHSAVDDKKTGSQEVAGSIPVSSTSFPSPDSPDFQ